MFLSIYLSFRIPHLYPPTRNVYWVRHGASRSIFIHLDTDPFHIWDTKTIAPRGEHPHRLVGTYTYSWYEWNFEWIFFRINFPLRSDCAVGEGGVLEYIITKFEATQARGYCHNISVSEASRNVANMIVTHILEFLVE